MIQLEEHGLLWKVLMCPEDFPQEMRNSEHDLWRNIIDALVMLKVRNAGDASDVLVSACLQVPSSSNKGCCFRTLSRRPPLEVIVTRPQRSARALKHRRGSGSVL